MFQVSIDSSFLEYLETREVCLQVHLVLENDCQTLATTYLNFSEILEYPNNKLHRTLKLKGIKGSTKDEVLGTIDFWFRLHTHDVRPIFQYEQEKLKTEQRASKPLRIENDVHFLQGEKDRLSSSGTEKKRGKSLLERKRRVVEQPPPIQSQPRTKPEEEKQVRVERQVKKLQRRVENIVTKTDQDKSKVENKPEKQERVKPAKKVRTKVTKKVVEVSTSEESVKRSFSSLSKASVNKLDNIIKNRVKPPRTFKSTPKPAKKPEYEEAKEEKIAPALEPAETVKVIVTEPMEEAEPEVPAELVEPSAEIPETEPEMKDLPGSKPDAAGAMEIDESDSEDESSDESSEDDEEEDEDEEEDDDESDVDDTTGVSSATATETNPTTTAASTTAASTTAASTTAASTTAAEDGTTHHVKGPTASVFILVCSYLTNPFQLPDW